jgi:hypothetical protein
MRREETKPNDLRVPSVGAVTWVRTNSGTGRYNALMRTPE